MKRTTCKNQNNSRILNTIILKIVKTVQWHIYKFLNVLAGLFKSKTLKEDVWENKINALDFSDIMLILLERIELMLWREKDESFVFLKWLKFRRKHHITQIVFLFFLLFFLKKLEKKSLIRTYNSKFSWHINLSTLVENNCCKRNA